MTTKQVNFLDWLRTGVQHKVITEAKAKKLYEEKFAPVPKMKFLEALYAAA